MFVFVVFEVVVSAALFQVINYELSNLCNCSDVTAFTEEAIMWPGGTFIPVVGEPPCGWNNEHCNAGICDAVTLS